MKSDYKGGSRDRAADLREFRQEADHDACRLDLEDAVFLWDENGDPIEFDDSSLAGLDESKVQSDAMAWARRRIEEIEEDKWLQRHLDDLH